MQYWQPKAARSAATYDGDVSVIGIGIGIAIAIANVSASPQLNQSPPPQMKPDFLVFILTRQSL